MARAATAAVMLLLAACGGSGAAPGPRPGRALPSVEIGLGLSTLPDRTMPKRGCAIFLWRLNEPGMLLLVAGSDPAAATIRLDGHQRSLPRAGVADNVTRYADGDDSIAVAVEIDPRRGLADGAVIPSGTLTLSRAGGAGMVVPVAGLIGCAR